MTRASLLLLAAIASTAIANAAQAQSAGEEGEGDEEIVTIRPEDLTDEEYLEQNGRHCAGRYKEQWVLSQLFAIQTNPEGAYNQLRLGLCFPLVRTPGVLFDYTNVEIGLINELTPAFTHLGGYAQITPLSFLVLRVEMSGLVYWPLPFPRAGYYQRDGYDDGFEPDDLPAGSGQVETGWNLNLIGVLRGQVRFNSVWGLILMNILNVGYWDIGEGSHYFNMRWDVILNGSDWVIANELFLGVETRISNDFGFRYGFFDSYRRVPNAGYDGHQLGIFAMGWWPKPFPALWDFTIFARAGVYVDHDFRTETFSVMGGLMTKYELGGI